MEIEGTKEVNEENKGCYILRDGFEKALKEMKNGKAVGVDEIPIELIKNMSEESKTELYRLCKDIYTSGEWPQDYLETILIPLQKKKNATKCEDIRTISLLSHAAKILLRILSRRLFARVEEHLAQEQFGSRRGRRTRDAIGLVRIISERFIEKKKSL